MIEPIDADGVKEARVADMNADVRQNLDVLFQKASRLREAEKYPDGIEAAIAFGEVDEADLIAYNARHAAFVPQ